MKKNWFKCIDYEGQDVLVMKDVDKDNDLDSIVICFMCEKMTLKFTMSYDTKEKRDEAYEATNFATIKDVVMMSQAEELIS